MIAQAKINEIERLLAAGELSQRKIAKMVGISRSVVGAIAAGTRPDYEALRREREESFPEPLGPLGRCGGCGGMVYTPCRLCRIRLIKERELRLARERGGMPASNRCANCCTVCARPRCAAIRLGHGRIGWWAD